MKGKRFWLLALLLIASLSLAYFGLASIIAGPLTIIIEIPPGENSFGFFKVANSGETPEEVTVSLADWSLAPNGEIQFAEPGTLTRSLADWINFSPVSFRIEPGEVQRVDFTINAPEDEGGDHWALFLVEGSEVTPIAETTGELQTSVGVKVRYGIKIFQHDPGATKSSRITSMKIVEPDPLKIKIVFKNTGNAVLWNVIGWVEIRDETGDTVKKLDIDEFSVLPDSERELEVMTEEKLPSGKYIALAIIDFGGDFLVGHELPFKVD